MTEIQYPNKSCPVCGGNVVLLTNGTEMCEKCHYELPGPNWVYSTASHVYGKLEVDLIPYTLTITNCEKFKVQLREIDVEFELNPDKLENVDTIIINGYKYVKEK